MRRELKTASTGEVVNPDIVRDNIPNGAVNSDKIEDGAIITIKLANGSIVTAKIVDGAVTTSKLEDGAVTSAKLEDGAVTSAKLGASSVTNEKVNNGAIDYNKLAQALKNLIDGKQSALSEEQLDAVNSGIDATTLASLVAHLTNISNPHSVTKSQVGLGNVDNTSDLDKPVSTAQQNALNDKIGSSDIFMLEVEHFETISDANFTKLIASKMPILISDNQPYFLRFISDHTTYISYIFYATKIASNLGSVSKITINDNDKKVVKSVEIVAQPPLESGVNLKTINGNSLLGSGDVVVGSTPKYLHTITMEDSSGSNNYVVTLSFINNDNTIYTKTTLPEISGSVICCGLAYGNDMNTSSDKYIHSSYAFVMGAMGIYVTGVDETHNYSMITLDLTSATLSVTDSITTL